VDRNAQNVPTSNLCINDLSMELSTPRRWLPSWRYATSIGCALP